MAEGARSIPLRMAKASQEDIAAGRYPATEEEDAAPAWFDSDDREHLQYLHRRLVGLAARGSLFRVVCGLETLLSDANALVDPAADHLALHPRLVAALEKATRE